MQLPSKKKKKRKKNYNSAHKMAEKFGKSWALLIYLSRLSLIID